MASEEFEDIKIVKPLDNEIIPIHGTEQHRIPFSLSATVPSGWDQCFADAWDEMRDYTLNRRAEIRDNKIFLTAKLGQVISLKATLEEAVQGANILYSRKLAAVEESARKNEHATITRANAEQAKEEENKRLIEEIKNLKFD